MTSDDRVRRRFLRQVAGDQAGALAAAFGAGTVRQVGFLALPWTLQHALDDGLVADDRGALVWWTVAIVAAGTVQVLGMCLWDWWSNVADGRAGIRLRAMLADRVVAGGDAGVGSGDLILRSGRDVDLVRVWVHGLATWAVIGTTVVMLVPGLFALSPLLLLVAAVTVPCLLVVAMVHPRRYEAAVELAAAAHGHRADHVQHAVASAVTSRGVGGGAVLARRHHDASADLTRHTVAASDRLARWQAWGNGIPTIAVAVGVLVGVPQMISGDLTVGGLVAFSAWMGTIGVAVDVGLARVAQTLEARVAVDRLVAVLDAPQVVGHGDADDVVRQRAAPGRLVALTGPTGCGKSTALRHWAEREPEAFLVPQRPLVLAGSVRLNLSLGDDLPDERLRAALADVALADELDLDDHLDGADGLSGGQVQRLALAQALVADPRVLLLDDVTSAVDASTEARIVVALRRRAADRVTVVVSHRPGVLAAADDVVEMAAVSR